MKTNPRSERDIRDEMVLPAGEYDFEVESACDKTSQKGNEMIELTLCVFAEDGSTRKVRDWLLTSMELKLNRFCYATGLQDAYIADELTSFTCQGATGKVKLGIEDSDEYGKQNRVKDYIVPKPADSEPADPPPPRGVPAVQTRRAMRDANRDLAEDDSCPF